MTCNRILVSIKIVRIMTLISIFIIDNVEMEIVLPGSMTVIDSHDIALALQHKIEAMVDVERAFVHVDHQERDGLEHKVNKIFLFVFISFYFFTLFLSPIQYTLWYIITYSTTLLHEDIRTYIVFLAYVIAYPFALPPPFHRSPFPFPSLPLSLSFIMEGVHMVILNLWYFHLFYS